MTELNRRNLFSIGMATAGLSVTPSWLSRWFAPQDPQDAMKDHLAGQEKARKQQLQAAIVLAQQQGKPLLVFVVPDGDLDAGKSWLRGYWFGAFLNHGGPLALLEVAMCVPACAKVSELNRLAGTRGVAGSPPMLLVDVGTVGQANAAAPKVTKVDMQLSAFFGGKPEPGLQWEERQKRQREEIEAELKQMTEALIKAMHQHGGNVATLAKAAHARLTEADRQALGAWFAGGALPADDLLVRAAAEVRQQAGRQGDDAREATITALLAAVERHVVEQPVAGGRWMIPGGCGSRPERQTEAEKKERAMIACGMAMTPPLAERFLGFYVRT